MRIRMISTYNQYLAGETYWVGEDLGFMLLGSGKATLASAQSLTDSFTRPANTTDYSAGDAIAPYALQVKQKDTITLAGDFGTASITSGGVTKVATFVTSPTATATAFKNANVSDYLAAGIVLTNSGADLIFEASSVGVPFLTSIVYGTSDLDGTVAHTTANVTAVKQKETLTLTGTIGEALITYGAFNFPIQFDTNKATTAGNFATAKAEDFLEEGVVLTNSGDTLVFEAQTAGTAILVPSIATVVGDLTGAVAHTQANVTAQKKKDTVTLTGASGNVLIEGTIAEHVFDYITTPTLTASGYVTAKAADYLPDVVLTSDGADLIFEAAVAGTDFTSPVFANVLGDLAGAVVNTTPNRVALKQKDTIQLSGLGHASLTLAGGLTKAIGGGIDLATIAAQAVVDHAAAYAEQGIVLTATLGGALVFESDTVGVAFTSPVITNVPSDLSGTIAHTTANRVAVKQRETITLTGLVGSARVTGSGGLTKDALFATNLTATALAFKTANATAYLAQGIVVTSNLETIVLEASVAGTGFTEPTIANIDALSGTIANTTANVTFTPLSFTASNGRISRINCSIANVGFSGKKIRIWFYNALPVQKGDNLALVNPCDLTKGAFFVDQTFEAIVAGEAEVYAQSSVDIPIGSQTVYALVQALEAITPVSEGVLTLSLTV